MSGSALASQIKEHMPVVGSDGGYVGTVDKMEESRIKLTKEDDPSGRAPHHDYLPMSAVAAVDGREVRLDMDARRAKELATMTGASSRSEAWEAQRRLIPTVQRSGGLFPAFPQLRIVEHRVAVPVQG